MSFYIHCVYLKGFTGGGLIGPLLVGALGYKLAFMLLGVFCFIPFSVLLVSSLRTGAMISPPSVSSLPATTTTTNVGTSALNSNDSSNSNGHISTSTTSNDAPHAPAGVHYLNPMIVFALELWFFFLMGQEISFSTWISSYVVHSGVSNSDAKAAYAGSAFYAAMLTGRIFMGLSPTISKMDPPFVLKGFINFQFLTSTLLFVFAVTWRLYEDAAYWVLIGIIVVSKGRFRCLDDVLTVMSSHVWGEEGLVRCAISYPHYHVIVVCNVCRYLDCR